MPLAGHFRHPHVSRAPLGDSTPGKVSARGQVHQSLRAGANRFQPGLVPPAVGAGYEVRPERVSVVLWGACAAAFVEK
jgi:hypothetical protein